MKNTLFCTLLLLFSISFAQEWNTEEILDHSGIGSSCDLEIDAAGQLHLCFQYKSNILPGSNLYYALKADATSDWEITEVDVDNYNFLGDDCDMDLDSDENPRISYLYEVDYEYTPYVKYAAFNGASWLKEQITSYPQSAGPGTAIVIDNSDNPHIFYPKYEALEYQTHDGTDGWATEVLDTGYMFKSVAAEKDPTGNIGIAYFYLPSSTGSIDLKYAYNDGTSWSVETAFNDNSCVSIWQLDMAYDQFGQPHIVYVATALTDDNSQLHHTWFDGSNWNTDNLGFVATGNYTFPSIAIDNNDAVHIAYGLRPTNSGAAVFHHVSDESDTWVDVIISDEVNCWDTTIEIDPDNQPHIVFYNYSGGITTHTWRTDSSGIEESFSSPGLLQLSEPIPNPSYGFASIGYSITYPGNASLELFDITGRLVNTLEDSFHQPGNYESEVSNLTPGIYLFRFSAEDTVETKKLVVL